MDTWRVLEELRAEGRVRHIGMSNFGRAHVDLIVAHARDPPECLQVSSFCPLESLHRRTPEWNSALDFYTFMPGSYMHTYASIASTKKLLYINNVYHKRALTNFVTMCYVPVPAPMIVCPFPNFIYIG